MRGSGCAQLHHWERPAATIGPVGFLKRQMAIENGRPIVHVDQDRSTSANIGTIGRPGCTWITWGQLWKLCVPPLPRDETVHKADPGG